jgi:hypothetical protein
MTIVDTGMLEVAIQSADGDHANAQCDVTNLRVDWTASPAPEPETYAMSLVGLGLLGLMATRTERIVV